MRISDWSSDVCSSDLWAIVVAFNKGARKSGSAHIVHTKRRCFCCTSEHVVSVSESAALGVAHIDQVQSLGSRQEVQLSTRAAKHHNTHTKQAFPADACEHLILPQRISTHTNQAQANTADLDSQVLQVRHYVAHEGLL